MTNPVQAALANARWAEYLERERALAIKSIPELGDRRKAAGLQERAAARLREIGFTQDELNAMSLGAAIPLQDHRIQRLVFDSVRFTDTEAPRSWNAEEKLKFDELLPPEIRRIVSKREADRDRELRRSQNRLADELKLLKEKKNVIAEEKPNADAEGPHRAIARGD
jgi:hypothetical protein